MLKKFMKRISELFYATEKVYDKILQTDIVGKSEKMLKKLILCEYRVWLKGFSFKGDILAGKRSALGEGNASDYIIKRGDVVILDLLPGTNEICSDITRTFFTDGPTDNQREVYDIVKTALLSTEKQLRSGIEACEIYEFMSECLKPYEKTFFHHAGHRIGKKRLLMPQFLPNKRTKLKVGDIVTLEPGIYFKDDFGIRIENDYLITQNGYERLFNYPLDLEKFIIRK